MTHTGIIIGISNTFKHIWQQFRKDQCPGHEAQHIDKTGGENLFYSKD